MNDINFLTAADVLSVSQKGLSWRGVRDVDALPGCRLWVIWMADGPMLMTATVLPLRPDPASQDRLCISFPLKGSIPGT